MDVDPFDVKNVDVRRSARVTAISCAGPYRTSGTIWQAIVRFQISWNRRNLSLSSPMSAADLVGGCDVNGRPAGRIRLVRPPARS